MPSGLTTEAAKDNPEAADKMSDDRRYVFEVNKSFTSFRSIVRGSKLILDRDQGKTYKEV
jgi:hypothetical protein